MFARLDPLDPVAAYTWINASGAILVHVRFEECTYCNFDYSGALSEAVLLGAVAYRIGQPLTWDAQHLKATNRPEADRLIHPHYRRCWRI